MSYHIPIHEMSLEEKLLAMETLWQDLSSRSDASPAWHESVLKERETDRLAGKTQYEDWEEMKKVIKAW